MREQWIPLRERRNTLRARKDACPKSRISGFRLYSPDYDTQLFAELFQVFKAADRPFARVEHGLGDRFIGLCLSQRKTGSIFGGVVRLKGRHGIQAHGQDYRPRRHGLRRTMVQIRGWFGLRLGTFQRYRFLPLGRTGAKLRVRNARLFIAR